MVERMSMAELLGELGRQMDEPEGTIRLAERMLRVRNKQGQMVPLRANAAQRRYEAQRGRSNIVLKARQMGMTTWIAGRCFLRTALVPGSTSLLVAHTREAAETIFGAVRRMWEELPEPLQRGPMRLRRSNAGELVFASGGEFRVASAAELNAGRGLSLVQLHCSEVGRWPGDAQATLAGLRAALVPEGELVLESTPNGAYGAFYEQWCAASDPDGATGAQGEVIRHFLPWWLEPSYAGPAVAPAGWSAEEALLAERHGLRPDQIGFRRGLERSFGAMRSQEFAEDAETCFRATGACCFELEAIERRLRELGDPLRQRRNGALLQWLPPLAGRQYLLGVDTAGGGQEGDYAVVQVVDLQTGMQCAELQERLRPAELARCAKRWRGSTAMRWWWWSGTTMEPLCSHCWSRSRGCGCTGRRARRAG